MTGLGKMLIALGLVLVGVGVLLRYGPRIPFLGRLPGDVVVQRPGFTFFFPLGTCILVSVLLSIIFWFLNR